ncbi:MAG: amidohydrolase family protein [Planctomycetota bacterium]
MVGSSGQQSRPVGGDARGQRGSIGFVRVQYEDFKSRTEQRMVKQILHDGVYRARWVLPIERPPMRDGWLRLKNGTVVEMGQGKCPGASTDLGPIALLPGLVNAHTHLEFSDLERPVGLALDGKSELPLHRWIGEVVRQRGVQSSHEKRNAITQGLKESLRMGTRLMGEIATSPVEGKRSRLRESYEPSESRPSESRPSESRPSESRKEEAKLDVIPFMEVIGLSQARFSERLSAAEQQLDQHKEAGVSPHAPYSLGWDSICDVISLAKRRELGVAMHVAETPEERQLLARGDGCLADALRAMGVWQDGVFPWTEFGPAREKPSHVDVFEPLIRELGRTKRALIVHGNDLTEREIAVIAEYPQLTVVYCPRTHAYFGHPPHPIADLLAAGVRVALGTDSRASNPDLGLWGEVQHLLRHRQDVSPDVVLGAATMNGADALGRNELGRFQVDRGGDPGFLWVPTEASSTAELHESLAETTVRRFGEAEYDRPTE